MTLFEWGLVAHLLGDFILQNDWLARNKGDLTHPAAWIHSAIHGILLGLVLGWTAGLILALVHILVDTRVPLTWWQRVYRQTVEGEAGFMVAVWGDQTLHILSLAVVVSLLERF